MPLVSLAVATFASCLAAFAAPDATLLNALNNAPPSVIAACLAPAPNADNALLAPVAANAPIARTACPAELTKNPNIWSSDNNGC